MALSIDNMPRELEQDDGFRAMAYGDLQQVLDIEQSAYSHPWTIGIFRDCIRVGYDCWVYMQGDRIAGYGILMLAAGEAHILNICVAPTCQGRGLGRRILRFLLRQCARQNIDMVILEVRRSNTLAARLYQSEGFHELGVRKDYYPADNGREDAIIFARYIQPEA